ncbi:MAG: hypothetical protein QOE99_1328 [Actinomycetota bacterium]|jgi:uncharacterized RDD family membrane protein YckC|nr:hypothetical protein [Actinomycetota bacterium]
MARWTGTWLSGLGAAGVEVAPRGDWRGQRFGLAESGSGSVASFGARLVAFVLDAVLSGLAAGLFTAPDPPRFWSFVPLGILYVGAVPVVGQTVGMRLLGLRVVRLGAARRLGVLRAILRFALLCLLIPAVITDRDGRGLHDKAAGTAVVRA